MQAQHSQGMKYWNTLFEKFLPNHSLFFLQYFFQLFRLLNAALSSNDGSNSALYRCLLIFQIFNFFRKNRQKLRGVKAVYAIQEDCAVVVRNEKTVPGLQ